MSKKRRTHATCKVRFEDYDGHLHIVVVRVPPKGGITSSTLARLAGLKTNVKPALVVGVECSAAKGGARSMRKVGR